MSTNGAKATLALLVARGVVVRVGERYQAGQSKIVSQWRADKPTRGAKPGGGGNGAAYRRAKAVRERLSRAEAEARRAGRLTSQPATTGDAGQHEATKCTIVAQAGMEDSMLGLSKIQDAAAALNIHEETIRRWHRKGKLTLVRLPGGSLRVRAEDLMCLMGAAPPANAQTANAQTSAPG